MSSNSDVYIAPELLNKRSVPDLYQKRDKLFGYQVVDLSSVHEIDSAGLALLVKWAKCQSSGKLKLIGIPDTALRLIKTYKLTPLFELECK